MFVVTVTFEYDSNHASEFRQAVLEQAQNSLSLEPDCHVFDVCFATDQSNTLFLYEKYTDASAFDAHLASAHFESFNTTVSPWVTGKTVATWLEPGESS